MEIGEAYDRMRWERPRVVIADRVFELNSQREFARIVAHVCDDHHRTVCIDVKGTLRLDSGLFGFDCSELHELKIRVNHFEDQLVHCNGAKPNFASSV